MATTNFCTMVGSAARSVEQPHLKPVVVFGVQVATKNPAGVIKRS
eukprot:CAMPEP_0115710690 /NCGR_PEP_ID=MMETSP0272-20121206/73150_1 /TAXON_ID=71861 /ORGANISM="Scrippsiella trochoidea, Strain CCMP3099" /LENGTH=44 /DNA_ID= /DNA_START= /DNA_END= /DNA_ORIENTATION=